MSRYESIIFMQGEDAAEPLDILDQENAAAAIEYLKQWHYPGEHETRSMLGHGSRDDVTTLDGYTLTVNIGLEYIGLEYDTEHQEGKP